MSYLKIYCLPFIILILITSLSLNIVGIKAYADETKSVGTNNKIYNIDVTGTIYTFELGEDEGILRWITISIYCVIGLILYNLGRRMKKIN